MQTTSLSSKPDKGEGRPLCASRVQKRFTAASQSQVDCLGAIWDEVVRRIVHEMMELAREDPRPLHVDIQPEMTHELAKLQLWLSESVIEKRTAGRQLSDIDVGRERDECLGPEGRETITKTAKMTFERVWSRKMDERWAPKSARAIERDNQPSKPTTLSIKPVTKNHFIPRWFIRDHWAVDGKVLRWRRSPDGWSSAIRPFGGWGYGHKLYSDRLEAYLSLLEGDAKRPIEQLLGMIALNHPQRKAIVSFLVIQLVRNPRFIKTMVEGMAPVLAQMGYGDDSEMPAKAYESLFQNNEFYDQLARPLMWSRWAIIKSDAPIFVLPDKFVFSGLTKNGLRMLVPLSPTACFVTLKDRESEKRFVPWTLSAEPDLAESISAALVNGSVMEFISHPSFELPSSEAPPFEQLLDTITEVIRRGSDDYL